MRERTSFGRRRCGLGAAIAAFALLALSPQAQGAARAPAGLPATAGPDLLREPPATAPELTNAGIWRAEPILVSGGISYRDGELLYQDHLFDDHGAKGQADPNTPQPNALAVPQGTYTYPKSQAYHGNDADLVELRLKPRPDGTAFRVTLNTMVNPRRSAFTLALGSPTSPIREYPFGAAARGPADVFVTVNGERAMLTGSGARATASVDLARKQVTVHVPHSAWNPGAGTGTVAAGVGLWDSSSDRYLVPAAHSDADSAGGGGGLANPTAFFNVAFRNEPTTCCASTAWRDNQQAAALARNDMAPFTAEVDFGKLAAGVRDDSRVPQSGVLNRIMSSHRATGVGVDLSVSCDVVYDCRGQYQTQLQPYSLYVPPAAKEPLGLTLLLHAHSVNHNQYSSSKTQRQLADRGTGTLVLTPLSRGPDGFNRGPALADVFEAWADVAANYELDPAFTSIAGYSMGAAGAYQIAQAYPDLFANAFIEVGGNPQQNRAPSLRHVPVMQWQMVVDEYAFPTAPQDNADAMIDAGYRYELWQFPVGEHIAHSLNDEIGPAAAWLGERRADENPHHVTYVVNPLDRWPELGLEADRAYWVSAARVREVGRDDGWNNTDRNGVIDAVSHGFGVGDPQPSGRQLGAGVLTGGLIPAMPYKRQYQTWSAPPKTPASDRLELDLTNIGAVTVDVDRARLSCRPALEISSDGPAVIRLSGHGCNRRIEVGEGFSEEPGGQDPPAPQPPPSDAGLPVKGGESGCVAASAGGSAACQFVGDARGSLGASGYLMPSSRWRLTHLVRRYALDSRGCPIRRPGGGYEVEIVRVIDASANGPGPILLSGLITKPGVVYTVTVEGTGLAVVGTVGPRTLPPSAASVETPEDRTKEVDPATICGDRGR